MSLSEEPIDLGELLGAAYQLAGAILSDLPVDPRHVQLLDMLYEAGKLADRDRPGLARVDGDTPPALARELTDRPPEV